MKKLFLFLTVGALLALAPVTRAQVTVLSTNLMLSNSITFGTVTTNLTATQRGVVEIYQDYGLGIGVYGGGTHATNTGLTWLGFNVSYDNGATFTTTTPIHFGFNLNGITPVRHWTNLTASVLNNATHIRLDTITNALANHVTGNITNVIALRRR